MELSVMSSRTHLRLLVLSFFSLLLASASIASASAYDSTRAAPAMVRLPGHVLPALSKATIVPSTSRSDSEPVTLTIVLKHDDQAGFERFLHDLYDPKSSSFHHFLTQRQIADRFGPSRADYDSVLAYLHANGFKLVRGSANRLTLTVRGSRAGAERAFMIHIGDYQANGHTFYANANDPALPAQLAAHVQAIAGLSTQQKPHHAYIAAAIKCEAAYITTYACYSTSGFDYQACVNNIFNGKSYNFVTGCQVTAGPIQFARPMAKSPLNSVPWNQVDGTGQTIGLLEFDTFNASDVSDYLALAGQSPALINQLSVVPVNGGVPAPGPDQSEVLLDIDTTLTLAPGANTVVYDAPFEGSGSSFQNIFNQMLTDKVTIISNSWAYCEDQTTAADVDSIDSIFQNAAAAGITVLNGSGDSGSTCLDGSANTIVVPADSPNATAVGGSSESPGPSYTYGPESWWNDDSTIPPAGSGGFGISKFFTTPSYQSSLNSMGNRSIPDVVVNADPFMGTEICEADAGGCPTGSLYGGTSVAAPMWAAFVALLNQAQGTNLGFLNPKIYPLAEAGGFHDAAALGSDFFHVGLGSPNGSALDLLLAGRSVGTPSATLSTEDLSIKTPVDGVVPNGIYDDGKTVGYVTVQLFDANGNSVGGKTVKLSHNSGSNAQITPASGVSSASNGSVTFQVADETLEDVTFTAIDQTDGVTLATPQTVDFIVPPAAGASLMADPSEVTADGKTPADITITLQDSLGRPTPGKLIQISQTGGNSLITGPNPPVTDSSGEIQFTVTDTNNESVTYSATDVTDGNLPFPETAEVTFSSAPEPGCGNGTPIAAPGYVLTPYVTGLLAENFSYGDGQVNFGGCPGVGGIAFDGSGNIYVSDLPTGDIYKLPSGGGVAGAGNLLNGTLGSAVGQLVYQGGNLYAAQGATTGGTSTGGVIELDPSSGTVVGTVVTGIKCAEDMAADPLSGDLFVNDACEGPSGSNTLYRVSNPGSGSATLSSYATLPTQGNYQLTFAPDGTIYTFGGTQFGNDYAGTVVKVGGTNTTQPATVTTLSSINAADDILLAAGTATGGGAQYLISGSLAINPNSSGLGTFDLTSSPPSAGALLANSNVGIQALASIFGPDGCIYLGDGNAVFRITDTAGDCTYSTNLATPSIVLSPSVATPNPAQGTSQTLTASVHFGTVPAGTPVNFAVTGANPTTGLADTNASGVATFSYVGAHEGIDNVTASTTISSNSVTSSPALVTWGAGSDVTFLSLNQSPKGAIEGQPVNLIASLTDVSQNPNVAVSGQTINFTAGSQNCGAETNAQGIATCQVTASSTGIETLSASFAGTGQYVASNSSTGFNVVASAATPTATPTATATRTATPTATPTPVVGKLKVSPKRLDFGDVEVGSNKVKDVKVINAGKVKKKKVPLPILIEMENGVSSPFSITQTCDDEDLGPKSKGVAPGSCEVGVTFAPTAAMKYSGTLMIIDNLEPAFERSVKLEGTGKEPKK
jgi:kumamolisin